MTSITTTLLALLPSVLLAAAPQDGEKQSGQAWAKGLDKQTIQRAALAHEKDPLSNESRTKLAPVLLAHFEDVPFVVCLDQVPGVTDEGDLGKALVWQIVFGTGAFLEEHPELSGDREAYMLAGLASSVRAYRNALAKAPDRKIALFDELDQLERQGRLVEHVRAHDCSKEKK